MRSLVRAETMIGGLEPRQVFWCNEVQAQHFITHRIAELIAPIGPTEIKPAEPAEVKKFSPEEQAGQSTASAPSNASGKDKPLSASQPDPASTTTTSRRSLLTLPKRK